MTKKKPLLAIRPKFSSQLVIAEALIYGFIGAVLFTFLTSMLLFMIFMITGLSQYIPMGWMVLLLSLVGFIGAPMAYFDFKRKALSRTAYFFHEDYLDFQDFQMYINRRRGRLRYHEIQDVFERANFLQGRERLTNVYLLSPTSPQTDSGVSNFPGLVIRDVPETMRFDDKIIELLEAYNARILKEDLQKLQQMDMPPAQPQAPEEPADTQPEQDAQQDRIPGQNA